MQYYRFDKSKDDSAVVWESFGCNPDDVFSFASLGKGVFGYYVIKYSEINLDMPLYKMMPEIVTVVGVKPDWVKLITAKMCLQHMTGLSNSGDEYEFLYKPGTQFNYSG